MMVRSLRRGRFCFAAEHMTRGQNEADGGCRDESQRRTSDLRSPRNEEWFGIYVMSLAASAARWKGAKDASTKFLVWAENGKPVR
jgi:hypothetical protein